MFIVPYISILVLKSGQGMNEQSPVATFLYPTNCCLCSGYYCVSQSVFVLKRWVVQCGYGGGGRQF